MATPLHKNSSHGVHEFNNNGRHFLDHNYFKLNLFYPCPNVRGDETLHFH